MDKYGIIGNPVEHSLSPIIHHAFAAQSDQTFTYDKIKASVDGFAAALTMFQETGGKGLNVTLPFKHEAYQLSDQQSKEAAEAQAASALQIRDDGSILAVNYDGLGLVQDLTRNHHVTFCDKSILIVGAGGATRSILGPLLDAVPNSIMIANRTAVKAHELAELFQLRGNVQAIGLNKLTPTGYDIIIHSTSLGHQGKLPELPNGLIKPATCCYDLSYGKAAQPFLNWAKSQGVNQCLDGIGMLVEHNAAVFYLWFGIYPDTRPVIEMLQKRL